MKIEIFSGWGEGKTELAAFDKALFEAGIANYNLIPLSSVIPHGAKIITKKRRLPMPDEYGHKLYVVIAESYASRAGDEAWAGLGWVRHSDNSGKGLFVEHNACEQKQVIELIAKSLRSMAEYRPEESGEISHKIQGAKCSGLPVCSIVAAVYKSEGWE